MKPLNNSHQHPTTILFTHYGDEWIRGSERCLLDLLTHLDRDRFIPVVWCNSETMANAVRALNVRVEVTAFPLLLGWRQPRFDIRSFIGLVRQGIQRVKADNVSLIHANSGAPNQWLNWVARACKIPLLTHLHARYLLRDRITLGLHQVAMSVGVSPPVIEALLQDGMPSERTCVIPNGIDTDALDQQSPVNIRKMLGLDQHKGKREFLIVTTGSLIKRKGMDLIISAISGLNQSGVPAHLAIIGEGPERAHLEQQIQQQGLSDRVHLLGERNDVAGLLRGGVDLFVSAAHEEVFGLVLAEASLARLAVVAPAVGGIPRVVVDGQSGILFPREDLDALTRAIWDLYHYPQLRIAMGEAGRKHVLKHFTIQQNVACFEKLYSQMLQDPSVKMRWGSHWQLNRPLITAAQRLLKYQPNCNQQAVNP
jgi:glycosyltransferase involved in cell wall biosynthesis